MLCRLLVCRRGIELFTIFPFPSRGVVANVMDREAYLSFLMVARRPPSAGGAVPGRIASRVAKVAARNSSPCFLWAQSQPPGTRPFADDDVDDVFLPRSQIVTGCNGRERLFSYVVCTARSVRSRTRGHCHCIPTHSRLTAHSGSTRRVRRARHGLCTHGAQQLGGAHPAVDGEPAPKGRTRAAPPSPEHAASRVRVLLGRRAWAAHVRLVCRGVQQRRRDPLHGQTVRLAPSQRGLLLFAARLAAHTASFSRRPQTVLNTFPRSGRTLVFGGNTVSAYDAARLDERCMGAETAALLALGT